MHLRSPAVFVLDHHESEAVSLSYTGVLRWRHYGYMYNNDYGFNATVVTCNWDTYLLHVHVDWKGSGRMARTSALCIESIHFCAHENCVIFFSLQMWNPHSCVSINFIQNYEQLNTQTSFQSRLMVVSLAAAVTVGVEEGQGSGKEAPMEISQF